MERNEARSLKRYAAENGVRLTFRKQRGGNQFTYSISLPDFDFTDTSYHRALVRINRVVIPSAFEPR